MAVENISEDAMEGQNEIETLFKRMMRDFEETSRTDTIYRKDIEELGEFKIQWQLCGVIGYQILALDHYAYSLGEALDDPDITFAWKDPDDAIRFLKGEAFDEFGHVPHRDYRGEFRFGYTCGRRMVGEGEGKEERTRKEAMVATFDREKGYHPLLLGRLPMFRNVRTAPDEIPEGDGGEFGVYIPINESLGTLENEILPMKVFKHFFDKASNIILLNQCPCRVFRDCQHHNHSIGCMHLGDDTVKVLLTPERGRAITKEDALGILEAAVDDGLVPILGRSRGEARGFNIEDTGHFMSMCFCCSCCCINGLFLTHGSVSNKLNGMYHRMAGITVRVDHERCVGCGECLEVCAFSGMRMADGIAYINQDRCLGCGRCENVCPEKAVSIDIDDSSRVNELIETLESYVDVEPQGAGAGAELR